MVHSEKSGAFGRRALRILPGTAREVRVEASVECGGHSRMPGDGTREKERRLSKLKLMVNNRDLMREVGSGSVHERAGSGISGEGSVENKRGKSSESSTRVIARVKCRDKSVKIVAVKSRE
jgi:hypothetical protein